VTGGVADSAFTNTKSVEILSTAGDVTLGTLARAAGVDTVNLVGAGNDLNARSFVGDLTVNGSTGVNDVFLNDATAGNKTLNLGAGQDVVTIQNVTGAAAGSVKVNFASDAVGDGTANKITVAGPNGNTVIDDEGLTLRGSVQNAYNVVGLGADGAADAAQNRGNFTSVQLGTTESDTLTTVGATTFSIDGVAGATVVGGNVYLNGGAGNDSITAEAAAAQRHVVDGGAGNDTVGIVTAATGEVVAVLGAGDDFVNVGVNAGKVNVSLTSGTNFVNFGANTLQLNQALTVAGVNENDILVGGTGRDTLAANSGVLTNGTNIAASNTSTNVSISGFEALQVQDALVADLTTRTIQSGIDTVTLAAGTTGARTIAFEAGSKTVNIGAGTSTALGTAAGGVLGNSIVVSATGTATTDSLVINNTNVTAAGVAATALANNAFANQAIAATGFESVTLNTGATATIAQTVGAITVRGANATPATAAASNQDALNLTLTGANAITTGAISANTNGTLTINASSLTAQATGTTLNLGAATVNAASTAGGVAAGQVVVTGSAGNDTIAVGTQKYTINAGAGNDTVTGTVKAGDVINAGEGRDELQIGAALTAASAAGVSGFEVLGVNTAATVAQDMVQFVGNSAFDTVKVLGTGTVNITNASTTLNTVNVNGVTAAAVGFGRLIDTGTNSLTVSTLAVAAGATGDVTSAITTLTANDEEALTLATGASVLTAGTVYNSDLTVGTLNAADLNTLTVTGAGDVSVTIGAAGAGTGLGLNTAPARTITVDASTATGNLTFNGAGAAANQALNITGPNTTTGTNTLTGGAGADIITAGSGADVVTGGLGIDTINLSAGGADTVNLASVLSAANRDVVTGFQVGTAAGADTVRLAALDTSAGTGAGDAIVIQNQAAAPVAAVSILAANDLLELSFNLFGSGTALDLDLYTDGTGLLGALGQPVSFSAEVGMGYIVVYQDGNAYLFHAADSSVADAGVLQANEIQLVGTFNGVAVGGFEATNFALV